VRSSRVPAQRGSNSGGSGASTFHATARMMPTSTSQTARSEDVVRPEAEELAHRVIAAGPLLYLADTKGGGTATVPAHPAVVEALAVVPIRNGLWWTVTAGTLSAQTNRHLRASGVAATAHQLRHWAGTSWYRASGHDLLITAALMRHVSVDTTMIYAKLDPTRPAEVARAVDLARKRPDDEDPGAAGVAAVA
jgi:integrase